MRKYDAGKIAAAAAAAGILSAGIWGFSFLAPKLGGLFVKSAELTLGQSVSVKDEPQERFTLLVGAPASEGYREIPPKQEAESPEEKPAKGDTDIVEKQEEQKKASCEIPTEKPTEEVIASIPYRSDLNRKDGLIEKEKFGPYTGTMFFDLPKGGQVRNSTSVTNEVLLAESAKPIDFQLTVTEGEPLVLIYHTHTSESYEPDGRDWYDSRYYSKTTDPQKNVTAVGDRICAELDKAGIPYLHDTLVHDTSYSEAYDSSRATVQALLKKYPSVKIVLDIHRDGIQKQDGTRIAPVVTVNGREAAQIMIISGCDDGTMGMPNYIKNYHLACALQSKLESSFQGLTRPILFDYRHYNQDLTTGSLLIEVGSHGNSLSQALYSGELVGKGLCELIREGAADK